MNCVYNNHMFANTAARATDNAPNINTKLNTKNTVRVGGPPKPAEDQKGIGCLHFQPTQGCSPKGKKTTIEPCTASIPDGTSGYCVCGKGVKYGGVGCKHP